MADAAPRGAGRGRQRPTRCAEICGQAVGDLEDRPTPSQWSPVDMQAQGAQKVQAVKRSHRVDFDMKLSELDKVGSKKTEPPARAPRGAAICVLLEP